MRRTLATFALGLLLFGCNDATTTVPPANTATQQKVADEMAAELKLTYDPNRTGADFVNQLRSRVKVVDGFLTIDSTFNYAILPASTLWTIQCGIGFTVIFGGAITGESGAVSNDISITLTSLTVTKEHCVEWGMMIANELRTMTEAKSH